MSRLLHLQNLTVESLKTKANQSPEAILFYASDNLEIKNDIEEVIMSTGF